MPHLSSPVETSGNMHDMSPIDGGGGDDRGGRGFGYPSPPAETHHFHITHSRFDPRVSLDDYNRIMLEYTQRQMASFVDQDGDRHRATSTRSRSSRSSDTSGRSGQSTSGILAGHAAAPASHQAYQPATRNPEGLKAGF
ncbi:hypothetical protein ASPZODRAFT_1358651 [Penicilliopsis zonata CBS 506.65]|uniref:Uncharacterized protein n=1 Tax=Penicilliopsis zonata CBS 506.65 TaxID=1073090 RepID=A0A1L9SNX6_9EURO|nr:hypothetical protein ASPZODRAFT_1358651 [Penicilliopsis zonata CBS 506.65]OJJ48935.1 hypothetical protein ASPZODRAFT_1358651 [Penicilliopsis zonata CBS 506.65]